MDTMGRSGTMQRPMTLSTSTLMNEPVRNLAGDHIGKVEDYMLDLNKGCVEYAVLSFGGFMGIGTKLFAIPWDAMQLDTENHNWILDVSEERLRDAPGFDKNNWPDMTNTDYRDSLQSFWSVNMGNRTPMSAGDTTGQSSMGKSSMGGTSMGTGQSGSSGSWGDTTKKSDEGMNRGGTGGSAY